MIRSITKADLPLCLEIFHRGYETVAIEFGLTEENCPDRGRANLPYSKLLSEFEAGPMMFGYFHEGMMVGLLAMSMRDEGTCKLNDLIVLPEHRGNGWGTKMLDFCKEEAIHLGTTKIVLGMINDNKRLKRWYESNGFVHAGIKKYEGAPFTVGYMECWL